MLSLQEVSDRLELEDLVHAYSHALDARDLLAGARGPVRDAVLLNSAAALVAFDGLERGSDLVSAMRAAVDRAAAAIDDGEAARLLEKWAGFSVR